MKNRAVVIISSVFLIAFLLLAGSYLYINQTTVSSDALTEITEEQAKANFPTEYQQLMESTQTHDLDEDFDFFIFQMRDNRELQLHGRLKDGNSFLLSIPVPEQVSG